VQGQLQGDVPPSQVDAGAFNVSIGASGAGDSFFVGALDNVRVYGGALLTSDVVGDLNTPIRPRLVAAYSFDTVRM
jgi:hypothetical protein